MGVFDFLAKIVNSGPSKETDSGVLAGPEKVLPHLKNVCKQKTSLNLQIDDRPGQFSSVFLKDLTEKQTAVTIDTLVPQEGNQFIENSDTLSVSYTFQEKRLSFDTRFLGTALKKLSLVKLSIPRFIEERSEKKAGNPDLHVETPLKVRLGHLQKICEQSIPLELKIDEQDKAYKSIFAKLQRDDPPELYINLISPKEGNKDIAKSRSVLLSYTFQNRNFFFESDFIEIEKKKLKVIRLYNPRIIEEVVRKRISKADGPSGEPAAKVVDRRKFNRVAPSTDSPLHVYLEYGKSKWEVTNISVGGTAFLTKLTKEKLKVGMAINNMGLSLPTETAKIILPKVIVRDLQENPALPGEKKNKCSVEFFELNSSDREKIEKYIQKREEELKGKPSILEEELERIDEF